MTVDGIKWDHTSAEAHARIKSTDLLWDSRAVVVRTFFKVRAGALPDMKAYSTAQWLFRPLRMEVRWTDDELARIELSGLRVLKGGGTSDRQRQSYQALTKEIERARTWHFDDSDHGIVVGVQPPVLDRKVFDVIDDHISAHPLPRLLIR